jgi:hypothetical protein
MRPENRMFVSGKHPSNVFKNGDAPNFHKLPTWASRHSNQSKAYQIQSINAIYFANFLFEVTYFCHSYRDV